MNNGGYIMVDMTGWNTSAESTIPGIFSRVRAAFESGKPIVLSGMLASGTKPIAPAPAYIVDDTTSFFITIGGNDFELTNEDVISGT